MRNYDPDRYKWPPQYRLNVYRASGRFRAFWDEKDLDLADTLMWSSSRRQVILGVTSKSKVPAWRLWNSRTVRKVEWLMHYDLNFDGYAVQMRRISRLDVLPCFREFRWALTIVEEP